jgi:glycosyltransferase involved in cell wall biosynthesis
MFIGVDGSEAFVKNKTGVENYAFQILLNLSKLDQKNRYLIYLDRRSNEIQGEWPENFKFKFLHWPLMWTQLGLALQTYLDHLDLLFIPGHTLPILKNPFLKSVVTVHDLGAEYLPAYHQWKQRLYLGLMTKLQIRFATKIIAVSEATKKDLVNKIGIKGSKIQVIYEALVPEAPIIPRKGDRTQPQDSIFKQFDIEKGNYFLFVGTIQPRKNLVRVIEAFNQVSQSTSSLKLVFVGKKGWLSDEIYEQPRKLGIEDKVVFTGRLPDQDVHVLYMNALAVVYPSLFEGFGLPILEAFEAGAPVLTSNVSSMPEIAGDAALLVDPYSAKEIAAGMRKLYADKKLRQELVKKGQEQLKKFSWEKAARQTLQLFESIIEHKS